LLQQYGTLEGIYENIEKITGKKRENLIQYRDRALQSRQLVRLNPHVPVEIDWNAGRINRIDRRRVLELFDEFGFRRLGERLDALAPQETPAPAAWQADYQVVATEGALDQLVQNLASQKRIAFDTETTSINPRAAQIVGY